MSNSPFHEAQCDQIGRFSKVITNPISYKISPNIWYLLCYFGEHFLVKTAVATFWSTFGNLSFQHLVTLSNHTYLSLMIKVAQI